jgi:hypothetical protein
MAVGERHAHKENLQDPEVIEFKQEPKVSETITTSPQLKV